ncbi:MAG: protein-tyrosine-phosphatase [Bacteroidota bacterium]
MSDSGQLKVLFVCGKNKVRSKTAAFLYRSDTRMQVRSAGLSPGSPHQLNQKDLEWADVVMMMEFAHKKRIQKAYRELDLPELVVLVIPDEYVYMEEELVEMLRLGIENYFS